MCMPLGILVSRIVGRLWLPALVSPSKASWCFLPLGFYRSGDFSLLLEFLSFLLLTFFFFFGMLIGNP